VIFRRRGAGRLPAGTAWLAADADRSAPATEAARAGADLRAARLRLGLALPDAAAKLRIKLSYLEAVEDGRLDDLPGPVYAVGFARAYAVLLGLDADAAARRFRPEADAAAQKAALDFPTPAPERGVPAGAVVLLGGVLAVAAYAGWYKFSDDPRPPVVQVLPERFAPLASRATPAAEPPPVAAPAEPPAPASTSVLPPPSAPPSLNEPVVPPLAVAPPPPPPAPPPGDDSRILLRANADAWMQVRERGGHVLLNRVLRGGESWAVPKGPALLLTTGNAGGTELLVDGETTPSLGPPGAVRRDIALEPDGLRAEITKAASTARPSAQ